MSDLTKLITLITASLNMLMIARGIDYGLTKSIAIGCSMLAILFINWVTDGDSKFWSSMALWSYPVTIAGAILSF